MARRFVYLIDKLYNFFNMKDIPMPSKLVGIAVYKIKLDGCIQGTWTNTSVCTSGRIMNESGRKKNGDSNVISGEYVMSYIEEDNKTIVGDLIIEEIQGIFYFEWISSDKSAKYYGIGLKSGKKHLSVSYYQI